MLYIATQSGGTLVGKYLSTTPLGFDEHRPSEEHHTYCFLARLELVMPTARELLAVMRKAMLRSSCCCRTRFPVPTSFSTSSSDRRRRLQGTWSLHSGTGLYYLTMRYLLFSTRCAMSGAPCCSCPAVALLLPGCCSPGCQVAWAARQACLFLVPAA